MIHSYNRPAPSSHRPKAAFLIEPESFDAVFGPDEIAELRRCVDLVSEESLLANERLARFDGSEVEALFTGWGNPKMDQGFLDSFPNLKVVFHAAGSVKAFVTDTLWDRQIRVSCAAQMNAIPVAEFAFSQIIFSLKHGWQRTLEIREQKRYRKLDDHLFGAYKSTVGLLSLGHTGRKVLDLLRMTDISVIVYDPHLSASIAEELGVERASLDEVFARSHVVSCHTPLLPATVGMLRRRHFELMQPGASFINTARGAVVNEPELVQALQARPDIFAVLDVTDPEPPALDSPILSLPNAVITPHIAGSLAFECRRMGQMMIADCERYLRGERLVGEVFPEQLGSLA